ncbi:MAG: hypothetical protein KatS3mg040_1072 [Candidatus Kapaibacterium sp.]|nr:MAG: hypothetical protein KatS3mg040_1072 [Candidatus Kapabacteria bacterium]
MNTPKPLAHYLQILLDERGLRIKLDEARVPEVACEILGPAVLRRVEKLDFHNGELILRCHSSIWRIELRLRAEHIRHRINERFGREIVRAVSVL